MQVEDLKIGNWPTDEPLILPDEKAVERLRELAKLHSDETTQRLCDGLAKTIAAVAQLILMLPSVSRGELGAIISVDHKKPPDTKT